jgi:hypothetical protein
MPHNSLGMRLRVASVFVVGKSLALFTPHSGFKHYITLQDNSRGFFYPANHSEYFWVMQGVLHGEKLVLFGMIS